MHYCESHHLYQDNIGTTKPLTSGQADPATQQVTPQVRKLPAVCVDEASRSRGELMKAVDLKDRVTFTRHYPEPALAEAFIEMTEPDSPTSPTRKYRLTERAKNVLEDGK